MTPSPRDMELAKEVITAMDCDSCQYSLEMRKQMTAIVAAALAQVREESFEQGIESIPIEMKHQLEQWNQDRLSMDKQLEQAKAEQREKYLKILEKEVSNLGMVNKMNKHTRMTVGGVITLIERLAAKIRGEK